MLHLSFLPATCWHSGRELDGLPTQHLRFSVRGTGAWADSPNLVPGSRLWSISCWNLPASNSPVAEHCLAWRTDKNAALLCPKGRHLCAGCAFGVTDISSAQAVIVLIMWALFSSFLQLLGRLEHLPHILAMPAFLVFHAHWFSYNISDNLEKLFWGKTKLLLYPFFIS